MNRHTKTDNRKICFVHLPKCGGTSLIFALRNPILHRNSIRFNSRKATEYAVKNGLEIDQYREQKLVELLENKRYNYIAGHYRCTQQVVERFEDEWDFITLMRNPINRWFSHYFYNRFRLFGKHYATKMNIDEYVNSKSGQAIGSMYIRFLTNHPDDRSEEAFQQAIENLKKFSLVGIIEEKDRFASRFESIFERPLEIKHKNKNPASKDKRKSIITDDIREQVEEICAPDMKLFEYARANLI